MKIRFFHSIPRVLLFQFIFTASLLSAETYLGYSNYQIITDSKFRAEPYFRLMAEHGVNFQRIWVTGYSDVATEFEELMPFAHTRNKYRLSEISPAYKNRLLNVMDQAESHNQRVMLTLFDHWSLARGFQKTPWYYKNNHERLLKNALPNFYDVRDKKLMRIQENLVRTIVRATKGFDPIYEIMNEAAGAKCDELALWHERVATWILDEFPEAEIAINLKQECPVLNASWVSIISFHENVWADGRICPSIQKYPDKHVIIDTDGAWETRDNNRLVKKWMAETLDCGGSFNHKDNIYDPDRDLLEHYRRITGQQRELR